MVLDGAWERSVEEKFRLSASPRYEGKATRAPSHSLHGVNRAKAISRLPQSAEEASSRPAMSGRLHGEADERGQQCRRVRRQIGIAAKMLEHEIHERLHARGKLPAAHVVNEDARGLRHAFRQHGPQRARAKHRKNEGKGCEHQSLAVHCRRDERRDVVGQKVPADGGLLRLPLRPSLQGVGLRQRDRGRAAADSCASTSRPPIGNAALGKIRRALRTRQNRSGATSRITMEPSRASPARMPTS